MILPILTILIFLVTLGLLISAAYFFVEAPIAKQRLRARLVAVQQVGLQARGGVEADILRREALSGIPAVQQVLAALPPVARLQLFLQQAAVELQVDVFLLIVASAALFAGVAAILIGTGTLVASVAAVVGGAMPFIVLSVKRQRRFSRFSEQFPNAIELLARAVRAGHAFTTAFSLIGDELAEPVAGEFRLTHRQQNLGLPLREALGNLALRVPLPDVRIFVSALQIQRDSGGNLGEILDNLANVIRDRFRILREVEVVTAEARLSMYVLTALPFIAGFLMLLANPGYLRPLLTDPLGHRALAVGAVLQVLGYLIIRKIVRIKV